MKKILTFFSKKITIYSIIALVVLVGGISYLVHRHNAKTYTFVSVMQGSITEMVSVTGNTAPVKSVSLGFGNSGIVSHIYSDIGRRVSVGTLLATLDTGDLSAQLNQAQANVDAQKAKLQGMQSGSRPEDIAVSQASLAKAQQDLVNIYAGIGDIFTESYAKANDAIRTQLDPFFSNSESQNPRLTYISANYQAQIDVETERLPVGMALNIWQGQLVNINQSNTNLETLLQNGVSTLGKVGQLLNNVSKTLDLSPGLSATTLATYKSDVSTAINEVNTAVKNLNTISQNIASQKLTVAGLQAQLDLKKAGSTVEDISAQQAQVAQAEASVASVQAKLRNSQIIAPQYGIITQFDAKVGQTASPATALISIISSDAFEIDTTVSEVDVGKVALGDKVTMTLDAFPHETFSGSVFYIDPAQTNNQGVIGYKVKVNFAKSDSRMKSGLTVNLDIETKHKDNVLILPQYAILQNDEGTFVQVLENNATKQIPVMLGISDQAGNVEIVSGVTAGEQVLNIGLKQN